jgi:hypothetical protein
MANIFGFIYNPYGIRQWASSSVNACEPVAMRGPSSVDSVDPSDLEHHIPTFLLHNSVVFIKAKSLTSTESIRRTFFLR